MKNDSKKSPPKAHKPTARDVEKAKSKVREGFGDRVTDVSNSAKK